MNPNITSASLRRQFAPPPPSLSKYLAHRSLTRSIHKPGSRLDSLCHRTRSSASASVALACLFCILDSRFFASDLKPPPSSSLFLERRFLIYLLFTSRTLDWDFALGEGAREGRASCDPCSLRGPHSPAYSWLFRSCRRRLAYPSQAWSCRGTKLENKRWVTKDS